MKCSTTTLSWRSAREMAFPCAVLSVKSGATRSIFWKYLSRSPSIDSRSSTECAKAAEPAIATNADTKAITAVFNTSTKPLDRETTVNRRDLNRLDRKSVVSGKGVSVRVDLGGGRIITKKKQT